MARFIKPPSDQLSEKIYPEEQKKDLMLELISTTNRKASNAHQSRLITGKESLSQHSQTNIGFLFVYLRLIFIFSRTASQKYKKDT